jgi:hypothetical protein
MAYWVKRIGLKTGEVVTERELREDENLFQGPAPVVGNIVRVTCRGRSFDTRVLWGNWPGRNVYIGCRTPTPSMNCSLSCTGSRRVVPVPGLSSMRTPISVGPDADND